MALTYTVTAGEVFSKNFASFSKAQRNRVFILVEKIITI
jgi:hypothetical protein